MAWHKNFIEQVVASLVASVIFGIGVFLYAKGFVIDDPNAKYYYAGIGVFVPFVIILGLFKWHNRNRPVFAPIEPDFIILEKEIIYRYHDGNKQKLSYEKRVKIRVLKNGLQSLEDKCHWTGKGNRIVTSKIKNQFFVETGQKNVWQYYEIKFPKAMNKGEEIETHLHFDLTDAERSAVPFFSTSVEQPMELLIFHLELAEELGVEEAVCEISHTLGASCPIHSEIHKLDRGKLTWCIKKPKLLHHYEVRWQFN